MTCTFNGRSVKSSIDEIRNLCQIGDIIFLQEHWLFTHELNILSEINAFLADGQSSVDSSAGLLVGRPYGKTGILYRRSLAPHMSIIPTTEYRLNAVTMMTDYGPVLFICVYMPTDYGDYGCYENYVELCCKITAIRQ